MVTGRYRIRPPGCLDQSKWQWRVAGEVVSDVKHDSSECENNTAHELGEGPYGAPVPVRISGVDYPVEISCENKLETRVSLQFECKEQPAAFIRRFTLEGDSETQPGTVERNVKLANLLEPRRFTLKKTVTEEPGSVTLELISQESNCKKATFAQRVTVSSAGSGQLKMTIVDRSNHGAASLEDQLKRKPVLDAFYFRRAQLGQDIVYGKNKSKLDGMLERLKELCAEEDCWATVKDVWVEKLKKNVPLKRKCETGTGVAAFRAEAVVEGTVSGFWAIAENLGAGGHAKKVMTPENEQQETLFDDGLSKRILKLDKIAPWPISKRDYLFTSVHGLGDDGSFYVTQSSHEDPAYPARGGIVRGIFHDVGFRVIPVAPNRIKIMQMVHADPVGLPKSAVEAAMTDRAHVLGRVAGLLSDPSQWRNTGKTKYCC